MSVPVVVTEHFPDKIGATLDAGEASLSAELGRLREGEVLKGSTPC